MDNVRLPTSRPQGLAFILPTFIFHPGIESILVLFQGVSRYGLPLVPFGFGWINTSRGSGDSPQ